DLALLSDTIDAILAGRTPTSVNRAGYEPQPVDLATPSDPATGARPGSRPTVTTDVRQPAQQTAPTTGGR
ncbi:MAG: hypothetical protein KY457_08320, partial [Actinobacteria bacterium]|nr:hypothetical protein [Actinomycetota bacterium]